MQRPGVILFYHSQVGLCHPNRITGWQHDKFYLQQKDVIWWSILCGYVWFIWYVLQALWAKCTEMYCTITATLAPLLTSITYAGATVRLDTGSYSFCMRMIRISQWFCSNTPKLSFPASAKNDMFCACQLLCLLSAKGISQKVCFPRNLVDRFTAGQGALS